MDRTPIRTDSAWSEPDRIHVKGFDLCNDILGKFSLGDMAFLELTNRLPKPNEAVVFNAIAVTLVEHGLTPSAIATRLTYAGVPEAMQAAVAAGLCGLGSVFVGSMEVSARMLREALPDSKADIDIDALAVTTVAALRACKQIIPGIGHHFHKPVDPSSPLKVLPYAAAMTDGLVQRSIRHAGGGNESANITIGRNIVRSRV